MKFIHCSDIHLGAEPEAGKPWAEARKSEVWDTFGRILAMCRKENADLLIISGDLFDRQPSGSELRLVNEMFASLGKIRVVLMAASSDYISPRSNYRSFKWNENVVMLSDSEPMEIYLYGIDTTVYGFSYYESELTTQSYRDLYPKKSSGLHILLAYGGAEGGSSVSLERLSQAGFDYVAMGQSHNMKKINENMYYPGSPEPLDRTETGEHGVIVGEFGYERGEYKLNTRFVPMAGKKYIELHVRIRPEDSNASVLKKVTAEMLEQGAGNLYIIMLEGIRRAGLTIDIAAIAAKGMVTEVTDNTVIDINYEELFEDNKDNVLGQFMERLSHLDEDEGLKDRALYYGVEALLAAGTYPAKKTD